MEELQNITPKELLKQEEQTVTAEPQNDQTPEPKTFTQEQLNAIIQRRLSEEREKARSESERKALMTLAEREEALNRREAEMKKKEAQEAASQMLASKGLPSKLSCFLNYTDEITLQDSTNSLEETFKRAVLKGVQDRFKMNGGDSRNFDYSILFKSAPVPDSKTKDSFINGLNK